MKLQVFTLAVLLTANQLLAQSVGINTNTPHASALLDISSTSKGLLAPRMTTAQRTAISNPAKGLLLYDTDFNSLYHYNGSAWAAVGGGGGGLTLPYTATPGLAGIAFKIDNLGPAIQAVSSNASAAAITGVSTGANAYGLLGQNQDATGVGSAGFSTNGTAVYAFSSGAGTALRGVSTSGYGLFVSGNLRLTGGNTSPAPGAVLTSIDANGNAIWKKKNIGFSVVTINPNLKNIPSNVDFTVHFNSKEYDYANNFNLYTGSTPSFGHSTFVAPVSGLYHFDAAIALDDTYDDNEVKYPSLRIRVQRGANVFAAATAEFSPLTRIDNTLMTVLSRISRDVKLVAGDIVTLVVKHQSGQGIIFYSTANEFQLNYFNCHLVFEE
jgi:hypothetical protein